MKSISPKDQEENVSVNVSRTSNWKFENYDNVCNTYMAGSIDVVIGQLQLLERNDLSF